jgi:hypothetical protein
MCFLPSYLFYAEKIKNDKEIFTFLNYRNLTILKAKLKRGAWGKSRPLESGVNGMK